MKKIIFTVAIVASLGSVDATRFQSPFSYEVDKDVVANKIENLTLVIKQLSQEDKELSQEELETYYNSYVKDNLSVHLKWSTKKELISVITYNIFIMQKALVLFSPITSPRSRPQSPLYFHYPSSR